MSETESGSPEAAEFSLEARSPPASRPFMADATRPARSSDALLRLTQAANALQSDVRTAELHDAIRLLQQGDPQAADEIAHRIVQQDENLVLAWRVMATAREQLGDFSTAFFCAEQVFRRAPETPGLFNDLGRLAYHLKQFEQAEQLFLLHVQKNPGDMDGINNLACALRDLHRYDDAQALLKAALEQAPQTALLWNNLATLMIARGDAPNALIFFDEAIRVDPGFAKAYYNRANLKGLLGDADGALRDGETACTLSRVPTDQAMMRMAVGLTKMSMGRIVEGLADYEARLDPHFDDATLYPYTQPTLTLETQLQGKRLLLLGEQGLGDEVMFASTVPDLLDDIGPQGKLYLAVEQRLQSLYQRSFPTVEVGPYATGKWGHQSVRIAPWLQSRLDEIDCWAPMGAAVRRYRKCIEDFPTRRHFLTADPDKVFKWRQVLAELGPKPKIGVLWKSLFVDPARSRQFTSFTAWAPVLGMAEVTLVTLQYGDCRQELAAAREAGFDLWSPPGIDLKDDLDDLAALCVALDLVVGPANATTNIAAACGGEVSLVAIPGAWTQLGTPGWPWYPQLRVMPGGRFGDWSAAMAALHDDIRARFKLG